MARQITAGPIEAHTKGELKRMRKRGFIPISVQHRGEETIHLQSRTQTLDEIMRKHGESVILDLVEEPAGKTKQVLIHDVQRDPISRRLLQVTLQTVIKGEPIRTHVPIRIVGEPEPIRLGTAVLQHSMETLEIRSIPDKIPDHLTVDISALDVGESVRVSDLPPTTEYEVLAAPDTAIVSVVRLRLAEVEETPEEEGEEGAAAEAPAEEAAEE